MKKIIFNFYFLIFLICDKKYDELSISKKRAIENDTNYEVKDFIWKKMNAYYLWQANIENLADDRFEYSIDNTNATSANYVYFLKQFLSPKDLFKSLLYKNNDIYGDRFSFITDDYKSLENSFQGVSDSTGLNLNLKLIRTNNRVVGIVNYVTPNSDAERKGVKRGDIFMKIDNVFLTPFNYQNLIYSKNQELTFSFYRMTSSGLEFSKNITIKQQEIHQNPIFIHKIIQRQGKKIGYLMYNSFITNYDDELNQVFLEFKNAGIDELILDLRYNSGGYVTSATRLASMISGVSSKNVFIQQQVNPKLEKLWGNTLLSYFTERTNTSPIHTLNFARANKKLYVITSNRTASASELIINNLKPYMNIVQIGDKTVGKNLASVTIYDSPSGNKENINKNHTWAMQPIVIRSANANGFGDYQAGISPDYQLEEDDSNMGVLGELSDPLLAKTIEVITGERLRTNITSRKAIQSVNFDYLDNSESHSPLYNRMFIDIPETK